MNYLIHNTGRELLPPKRAPRLFEPIGEKNITCPWQVIDCDMGDPHCICRVGQRCLRLPPSKCISKKSLLRRIEKLERALKAGAK